MNITLFPKLKEAIGFRTEPEAQQVLAHGLWRALLALIAVAGVVACVWGAYTLSTVFSLLEDKGEVSHTPSMVLDKAALSRAMSDAFMRSQRFEYLREVQPTMPDPSR